MLPGSGDDLVACAWYSGREGDSSQDHEVGPLRHTTSRVLQTLRVNETRDLKWLERKGLDIQVSFLFEIQDSWAREFGFLALDA
jgi:hypothetical protein